MCINVNIIKFFLKKKTEIKKNEGKKQSSTARPEKQG
jgi:hypothetical protein